MKNVEFIRSGYIDGDKRKGMMQNPIFKSKGKTIYECKAAPETEKEVIAKFQMLEAIEHSESWSSSVATLIAGQKNALLSRLMDIRIEKSKG